MTSSLVGGDGRTVGRTVSVEQIAKIQNRLDSLLGETMSEIEEFETECQTHNGAAQKVFESSSEAFMKRVQQAKQVIARPAVITDDNDGPSSSSAPVAGSQSYRSQMNMSPKHKGMTYYDLGEDSVLESSIRGGGEGSFRGAGDFQFSLTAGSLNNTMASFRERGPASPPRGLRGLNRASSPHQLNPSQLGSPSHGGGDAKERTVSFLPSIGNFEASMSGADFSSHYGPNDRSASAFSMRSRSDFGPSPSGSAAPGSPLRRNASVVALGKHRHSHYVRRLEKVELEYLEEQMRYKRAEEERKHKFDTGCYGLYFPHMEGTYPDPSPSKRSKVGDENLNDTKSSMSTAQRDVEEDNSHLPRGLGPSYRNRTKKTKHPPRSTPSTTPKPSSIPPATTPPPLKTSLGELLAGKQ